VTLFAIPRSFRPAEHNLLEQNLVVEWAPDVDNWRDESACQDLDTELFFPVGKTGPAVPQIEAAKAICAGCEARAACLHFAVTTNQEYGVWGGTSEEERLQLRRAWRSRQTLPRRPDPPVPPLRQFPAVPPSGSKV
jgi:WhiB family transcriptional regulator, redox-sensing transcriptional regulator